MTTIEVNKEEFNKKLDDIQKFNGYDGSDDRLNFLRECKKKTENLWSEIQKKIDSIIIENNNFEKYKNAYIKIPYNNDGVIGYFHSSGEITRLTRGCRINGVLITIAKNDDGSIYSACVYSEDELDIRIDTDAEIITKEEFDEAADEVSSYLLSLKQN